MSVVFKRTKILATVGPAVNSYEAIEKMVQAGVNGFRLNFSHGSYEERDQQIIWIREASRKAGKPVAILQDLQGPKIRCGAIRDNNLEVKVGDELTLDSSIIEHDGSLVIPVQFNLATKVKVGQAVFIFDGKIRTKVTEIVSDTSVKVVVETPGTILSKKTLNLPDTDFSGDILMPKDYDDIAYGATKDFDYVALTFVQSADDIHNLRRVLQEHGYTAQVIAKVETQPAVREDRLEEIVKASDGIMIARGDLAVEVGIEKVPTIQRKIISLCRKYGKLSIVATQMMASMVERPEPTRAEAGDVANAVMQGADTVMLSDETANGKYPLETITAMKKIVLYTEQHMDFVPILDEVDVDTTQRGAISGAASSLAHHLGAGAIIAETKSGATAANIAAYRPSMPIISVTSEPRTAQQLALSYANKSFVRPFGDDVGFNLTKELKESDFFDKAIGELTVVIVSGTKLGGTDTIKVRVLE